MFSPSVQREIDLAAAAESGLQGRWPEGVQLRLWRQSAWYELSYAFLPAFPSLNPEDIRPLGVFGRLFANSIFLHDPLADREVAAHDAATSTLRIMAMQFEAYRLLHQLLPPDAPFWGRLRTYLAEYAEACLEELRFASGARPWREYSEDLAVKVAIRKSGPSRAIIAALVDLAQDDSLLDPLIDALNHFNVACQMWDDLNDWREDLRHGMPSLLLSRVVTERPAKGDIGPELEHIGREIYYRGHAGYTLDLALASLEAADRVRQLVPELPWYQSIDVMRQKYQAVQRDINRIMRANVERARRQRKFCLDLPSARSRWQQVAWAGALFLVRQWQLGFGEARDTVRAPEASGSEPGCQSGDIFQRALIVEALCDLDEILQGALRPVVDDEVAYLLARRRTSGIGGWAHVHDSQALPPDADTLAQVMRALLRSGRRADVEEYCKPSLDALLRDCALPDGGVKTWIVDAVQQAPGHEAPTWLAPSGDAVNEEVVANILHALEVHDRERFGDVIRRGVGYLEGRQRADGWWEGGWSHGPYYAVYVCVRLFAAASPGSPAARRALDFLRSCQREDGGWGLAQEESDPLSTALALLALAEGRSCGGGAGDLPRAARALGYLEASRGEDGSWPSTKLIRRDRDAPTGSRTLTTTFVLKATLAWHRLQEAYGNGLTCAVGERSL